MGVNGGGGERMDIMGRKEISFPIYQYPSLLIKGCKSGTVFARYGIMRRWNCFIINGVQGRNGRNPYGGSTHLAYD